MFTFCVQCSKVITNYVCVVDVRCLCFQDQMTEEMKDFIGGKIKRSSPEDKVKDLLEWMTEIYDKMKHQVGSYVLSRCIIQSYFNFSILQVFI